MNNIPDEPRGDEWPIMLDMGDPYGELDRSEATADYFDHDFCTGDDSMCVVPDTSSVLHLDDECGAESEPYTHEESEKRRKAFNE